MEWNLRQMRVCFPLICAPLRRFFVVHHTQHSTVTGAAAEYALKDVWYGVPHPLLVLVTSSCYSPRCLSSPPLIPGVQDERRWDVHNKHTDWLCSRIIFPCCSSPALAPIDRILAMPIYVIGDLIIHFLPPP